MARYAVIGATSWGATLSSLLAANGHQVVLGTRTGDEARAIAARGGLERLPGLRLGDAVEVCAARSIAGRIDGLVAAMPAQHLRQGMAELIRFSHVPVLSAAKGVEHGTRLRMTEVVVGLGWPANGVAALSGPNLAHEIARGLPAAAVVASRNEALAETWQHALSRPMFRVYRSADVVGVELGGALKNVIAIAAGAASGLELGANAVAAIMTRGLAEMTRLAVAAGADPMTLQGLAGVGDLAATCFSPLSRNRRLGELLARGSTVPEALAEIGEAVEGAATAPVVSELAAQYGVDMPIAAQVAMVLAGERSVPRAMEELLQRTLKPEVHGA